MKFKQLRIIVGLLITFILSSSLCAKDSMDILSWNTKRLSLKTIEKKDKHAIMSIINDNKYDVVTLQEVMDKHVLTNLTDKKIILSKKLGRKSYKEHIAFIVSKELENKDLKLIPYYDSHDSFERDPVMLLIDNKIGIVSVHLLYGRKSSLKYTGSGKTFTKKEAKALKNMFKYFSKKASIKESNIIVVGDFNLNKADMSSILENKDVYINKPTTLTIKSNKLGSSSYDHFVVSRDSQIHAKVNYDVLNKYYNSSSSHARKKFKKYVSDHYPIEAKFYYNY